MSAEVGTNRYEQVKAVPSLEFVFTGLKKSMTDRISGKNLITFTRNTTGTYVDQNSIIQTAAINQPRFDCDPRTGEDLGLLIEESKTNLLTFSEEFNNASWVKYESSTVANAHTSPSGTQTADVLVESSNTAVRGFYKIVAVSAIPYTYSIYVKQKERKFITLSSAVSAGDFRVATFDVSTGTVTNSVNATASITSVGNGWYRCAITYTATATSSWYVGVQMSDSGTVGYQYSYTGNGTSGIYIWGAQLEQGSFPTSYIPTTTSTVTRGADVASITGTNFSSWYNQTEGTWFGSIPTLSGNSGRLVEVIGPSASDYSLSIRPRASSSRIDFARLASGASQINVTFPVKIAASYNSASIQGAANGTLASLVTSGSHSNSTSVDIGRIPSENTYLGGTISRLTYWPERLADIYLQELTQ